MDLKLHGKTAFISGSTAGIGFATARRLLQEGAVVVINGRSQQGVDTAVQQLQSLVPGSRVSGIAADFSKGGEADRLIDALPEIDILINNAGIFEPKPFGEIPDADWFRFFEVNVMSGVRMSRALLPKMLARNWGRILFVSSESAVMVPAEMIHYGMTKTAQLSISTGLAQLTKGTGVTVNSIMPGPTMSKGVGGFLEDIAKANSITVDNVEKDFFTNMRPGSLINRFASVEEIADTIAYFVSPLASASNGAAIRAEGGLVKSIV